MPAPPRGRQSLTWRRRPVPVCDGRRFEQVGPQHYRTFFAKVGELLADDGVMLLHSIGRMSPPGYTSRWISKYIFPGGSTPALSEVFRAVERAGLWVLDVEVLRLHYISTLRHWQERFEARRDEARALYGEKEAGDRPGGGRNRAQREVLRQVREPEVGVTASAGLDD